MSDAIEFGISLRLLAGAAAEARRAEAQGFDYLLTGEHIAFHGPTANNIVSLAAAAGATERIKLMSGIILALSRAIGESAPILIISSLVWVTFVPVSPDSKFTVLPLQIFTWISQPQHDFRGIAAAAIIVLLIVLLSMNGIAIWIRSKYQVRPDQ